MTTTATTEHGHRVTWVYGDFSHWLVKWYADCPCGAEVGPFHSAQEARAAELVHLHSAYGIAQPSPIIAAHENGPRVRPLAWRGQRRPSQTPMIGRTTQPATELVQERFDKDWARLEVTDAETGEQVGGIDLHPDTGKRSWWADGDGSMPASLVSLAAVLSFLVPLGVFLVRAAYQLSQAI